MSDGAGIPVSVPGGLSDLIHQYGVWRGALIFVLGVVALGAPRMFGALVMMLRPSASRDLKEIKSILTDHVQTSAARHEKLELKVVAGFQELGERVAVVEDRTARPPEWRTRASDRREGNVEEAGA